MADLTRIDSLVVRYEELRERGTPLPAEELCRDCPELLEELKRQIQILDSMNGLLGDEADAAGDDTLLPNTAGAAPRSCVSPEAVAAAMRFRVLHLHASGGLGEVLVATDEELHRSVALKRLQAAHIHNPQSRSRFLREAEITSRLEHPSIVPVHAVGQDAEGRPFYAMRFIQGETLRQASQQFHAADKPGRTPGERRLALRQLLSRFVAICNTAAYAHSLGILHRDIKPDNIVLGAFGETMLVDWGLAKDMRASDSAATAAPDPGAPEDADAPTIADAHAPTQQGAIIGTPGYMSPEQAAGHGEALGAASDVYSLGATLYLLLTGDAPFQGRHMGEILDKVKRGEFLPPRQRKRDIPAALDAICRKAMARQPDERYGSALALATDVEHWLADEPVSAWPEPWHYRARRWSARHRTVVASAAAAGLVALVSLTVATLFLDAAHRREHELRALAQGSAALALEQRDEAQKQQEMAAQNFKLAREAVDKYCTLVAQDPRLREYDLEDLRKGLLQTAARFCDEFVRRRSDDPEVLAEQGRAYLLLGFITEETGAKPEAIMHYEKARSVFAELAQAHPAAGEYKRHLANSHDHLGTLFRATGQPLRAREEYGESLDIRRELARSHPTEADYQNDLAVSQHLLGVWYLTERQWNRAREELCRSRDIRKELLRTHPDVLAYQTGLADVHNNLANVYDTLRQPIRADGELLQAQATWEELARTQPTNSQLRSQPATIRYNLGKLAEKELLQAQATWEELARVQPANTDFRSRLAMIHFNLGKLYADLRRADEAETSYKKALEDREQLVRIHHTVSDYQSKLARTYHNLGALYQETGRPAEAETAFAQALVIHKKLTESHPAAIDYAVDLGKSYCRLGYLLRPSKPQAALECFEQAAQTHEAVLRRQPGQALARESLGHVHAGRALVLNQLRRHAEALPEWTRAVELAEGRNRDAWQMQRALTMVRAGDHAAAVTEANLLVNKLPASGAVLYSAACVHALAAAVAKQSTQRAEADNYVASAVGLLAKARAAGYFKVSANQERLQTDNDLAALRSRDEFKQLLTSVQNSAQGR